MNRKWTVMLETGVVGFGHTATDDAKLGELIFQEIYDDNLMDMLSQRYHTIKYF